MDECTVSIEKADADAAQRAVETDRRNAAACPDRIIDPLRVRGDR